MFFSSQETAKLVEEAQAQEQQRILEETEQKSLEFEKAFVYNKTLFKNICKRFRSFPNGHMIIVLQRENPFSSDSDRKCSILKLVKQLHSQHQSAGQTWLSAYGNNSDSLYAFYNPTELTDEFEQALKIFSKDGFRIQRIHCHFLRY